MEESRGDHEDDSIPKQREVYPYPYPTNRFLRVSNILG